MSTPQATPGPATTTHTETDPSSPDPQQPQDQNENQDDYPDEYPYPFENHYTHTDEHPDFEYPDEHEHEQNEVQAEKVHGFINAHNADLKEHIRPAGTEELVEYLWGCILARVKLDLDLEKQDSTNEEDAGKDSELEDSTTEGRRRRKGRGRWRGKGKDRGKQRRFEVRTTKLRTPYSEKHFAVLGSVARRVRRKYTQKLTPTSTEDAQVMHTQTLEKQEKIVLLLEPRAGPITAEVLGSKDELERWWDAMLMPRFEEVVGENWDGILGTDKMGVSVMLAAGAGVRVFWAERIVEEEEREDEREGKVKVRLVRAHAKSVLDLREGADQDVVEGLLKRVLERAWEDDGRVPWEGVDSVQGEGRSMEQGGAESLMYRPAV